MTEQFITKLVNIEQNVNYMEKMGDKVNFKYKFYHIIY